MDKINVKPDGNSYIQCIALFIYNKKNEHFKIRKEIANYLSQYSSEIDNINGNFHKTTRLQSVPRVTLG